MVMDQVLIQPRWGMKKGVELVGLAFLLQVLPQPRLLQLLRTVAGAIVPDSSSTQLMRLGLQSASREG